MADGDAAKQAEARLGRRKTIIALVILLVPLLLFLLLRFTKQNYKTLPIMGAREARAAGDTVYHSLPVFALINQDDKPFTQDSLRGRMHVADFFFTTCPSICKKLTSAMAEVQREVTYAYQQAGDVRLVSYSIDPKRDSTSALRAYAKRYGQVPGLWTFVTGDRQAIFSLLEKGYLVPVADDVKGGEDGFFHSNLLLLVDPDLRLRGIYNAVHDGEVDKAEMKRLAEEIKVLRHEYREKGVFKKK